METFEILVLTGNKKPNEHLKVTCLSKDLLCMNCAPCSEFSIRLANVILTTSITSYDINCILFIGVWTSFDLYKIVSFEMI